MNSKSKNAVVLFTADSSKESIKKNLSSTQKLTGKLLDVFTDQIINTIIKAKEYIDFHLIISTDISSENKIRRKIKDSNSYDFLIQEGKNFGERFSDSIEKAFQYGFENVMVIGNDCPDITETTIINSFNLLYNKNSIVLGPANDGGFYLIGLKWFDEKLFSNIKWNTNSVYKKLLENIYGTELNIYELAKQNDIDNAAGLKNWFKQKSNISLIINKVIKILLLNTICILCFEKPFRKEEIISRTIFQKAPPIPLSN